MGHLRLALKAIDLLSEMLLNSMLNKEPQKTSSGCRSASGMLCYKERQHTVLKVNLAAKTLQWFKKKKSCDLLRKDSNMKFSDGKTG